MPKLLYLLRHGQSAEKQQGQTDKGRELTPTGVKEAFQIGTFLHHKKFSIDAIYSSTAERALTTAKLISDTIKLDVERVLPDDELFQASVRTFFEFIGSLDNSYNNVMCVGHNPVISYVAEYISNAEIGDMTAGGMAVIKFNISNWKDVAQGNGELIQYITPADISNR